MIKVSILCLSYNHAGFIKQALDSFLEQKTNFSFEVLINDDASNDGTVNIIKDYQKRYPAIFRPIFQKKNQYSLGKRNLMLRYLVPKARGSYLALCEGDDYWTDLYKLQKQVDFLENNPGYALCFHKANVIYENSQTPGFAFPDVGDEKWYTVDELLRTNYIPTSSVMYRRQKYEGEPPDISPGDWYLHLYHAQFGKIKFINQTMSVYRKHKGGVWWDYDTNRDRLWEKYGVEHLRMLLEVLAMYGDNKRYRSIVQGNINQLIRDLARLDREKGTKLLNVIGSRYGDQMVGFLSSMAIESTQKDEKISEMWQVIDSLKTSSDKLYKDLEEARKKIARMSRFLPKRLIARFRRRRRAPRADD